MAKFAIAACILLAVCGAQGGVLTSFLSTAVTAFKTVAEEQMSSMSDAMSNLATNVTDSQEQFKNIFEGLIKQVIEYASEVANETEAATEDVRDCVYTSYDIATLQEAAENATTCVSEQQAELNSTREEIAAEVEAWLTSLNETATAIQEKCSSNILTAVVCIAGYLPELTTNATAVWATITPKIASIIADSTTIYASCSGEYSEAVSNWWADVDDYNTAFQQCIAALEETDSSSS